MKLSINKATLLACSVIIGTMFLLGVYRATKENSATQNLYYNLEQKHVVFVPKEPSLDVDKDFQGYQRDSAFSFI